MLQKIEGTHLIDADGNPAGGVTVGVGIEISWQRGLVQRVEGRWKPNGALADTVIAVAIDRIQFFQSASGGKHKTRECALALTKLEEALHWLEAHARNLDAARFEGEHEV